MSGGFFRGTSADQDTRFSNKQAKLLKSQKFAPELEHLVDMSKVKMDVMRPWIANRVTELLGGFEDEVLINFIYGLLDGKEVNGKEIQISLTGFMEKNTGKFMKELWQLLISAQNNTSGVPQQFLDAKEEETRKKQAETDRIKAEMQKKREKESREIAEEKMRKLDDEDDKSRANKATLEPSSKHHLEASTVDGKEIGERNGIRGRSRGSKSPRSPAGISLSPRNRRSRSMSKSVSNSRSYSKERHKSRGLSRSPPSRGRSISSEGVYPSPRRSITPRRKYSPTRSLSPPIRRSSNSRRRSISRSRRPSPSPVRRRMRSPIMYRSRSPIRRRSRSPVRHRSRTPLRYRSRSPMRRRYPIPVRHRSRTPVRHRSPSPIRRRFRRSPSSPLRRSPSPLRRRSPITNRRRSPILSRHRSSSREGWNSPSSARRSSPSPVRKRSPKRQRSPVRSPRERLRVSEKFSPVPHARHRGSVDDSENSEEPGSEVHRPTVSLRSPQRDSRILEKTHRKTPSSSPSPYISQLRNKSPSDSRRRSPGEDKSPYRIPITQSKEQKVRDIRASPPQIRRDQKPRYESLLAIAKEDKEPDSVRTNGDQKHKPSEGRSAISSKLDNRKDVKRVEGKHLDFPESEKISTKVILPGDSDKRKVTAICKDLYRGDEEVLSHLDEAKHRTRLHVTETMVKSNVEVDEKDGTSSLSSGSDDSFKRRKVHENRKHKRSEKKEVTSDDSDDSEIEDRKEAKRRKKEEKRLRKEERRRRRKERRHRREERRAEKLKAKPKGGSDAEDTASKQKKLEIELREKALESLRAKKGGGH